MSRVEAIRKFIESSPNDPFPRYGLAMELKNLGQLDEARAAFDELERRFPDYAPQYLMHFNLLVQMEQKGAARALAARGEAAIRKRGDAHALGELQAALQALDDE